MKTVSNAIRTVLQSSTALGLFLMLGSGVATSAHAADSVGAMPPMAAPAPAAPEMMANNNEGAPSLPSAAPATSTATPPGGTSSSKNLAPLEDKVTDSVKNVVKQFGSIDNVNLEDLNSARQAVVKLEVLIDIEKHLAELDKIRSERGSSKGLSSVLPASALNLPAPMPSSSMPSMPKPAMEASFMPAPVSHTEVSRIIGADGHYTAVVMGKNYRIGDTMSDGSTIVAISAKTVETKLKDGTVHVLHIKGVDNVYGHTL